jgi:hypothetical protein
MSDFDEKVANPAPSSGGVAKATLRQLLARWRTEGVDGSSIDPRKPPYLVVVRTMHRETWRLVGRGDGERSVYELLEVRPLAEVAS